MPPTLMGAWDARVDEPHDLAHSLLEQQQDPDHLQPPAGRARAAADEAREQEQHREEARPDVVARGGEAGGGADGHRLEDADAQCGERIGERARYEQVDGGHCGDAEQEQQVAFELGIRAVDTEAARAPSREMQREVHARDGHEHDGDQLDEGSVELPDARVVGREPADGHGGERMGDRVERTHPRYPVGEGAQGGEQQVEIPQRLGGLGDPRRELGVLHRPRRLRAVELHSADASIGRMATASTMIPMPPSHWSNCR